MNGSARIALTGTIGAVAAMLAGCDPAEPGGAGEAPSVSPSTAAVSAPADDADLVDLLADFAPEIEGFAAPPQFSGGRPANAAALVVDAPDVVEPASCAGLHQASALATPADLGDASGDLVWAAGWFFPDGIVPDSPPYVPSIEVQTRVFGDPERAADLAATLLASDCTAYVRTATWDDGSNTLEHEIAAIDQITLDGLDAPTVRIVWDHGTATDYDAAGDVVAVDTRETWHQYVHVDGPHAISIETAGLEDEALVADVIAQFLDHMASR